MSVLTLVSQRGRIEHFFTVSTISKNEFPLIFYLKSICTMIDTKPDPFKSLYDLNAFP